MKPLETSKAREEKQKRKNVIIGVFISLLMLFSVVGYALLSGYNGEEQEGGVKYKDYVFQKTLDGWTTKVTINNNQITLTTLYLPKEVENITSQGSLLLSSFMDRTVYIVANNLSERQAAASLAINLDRVVFRMQGACPSEEQETDYCVDNNLPAKNCDDATQDTTIIILEEKETLQESSINYKNNCLVITGNGSDIIKAAEKSVFMIYGIID
ncbi:MAG: hypothetical protein K6T16_00360 [Candidatus Pacearchaeota archaeon]|nr:hypothetical protein [Candidatus Pacearchaeota archaeon]